MFHQNAAVNNGAGLAVWCVPLGTSEATVETERSRDFNIETVADSFPLHDLFFCLIRKELSTQQRPANSNCTARL